MFRSKKSKEKTRRSASAASAIPAIDFSNNQIPLSPRQNSGPPRLSRVQRRPRASSAATVPVKMSSDQPAQAKNAPGYLEKSKPSQKNPPPRVSNLTSAAVNPNASQKPSRIIRVLGNGEKHVISTRFDARGRKLTQTRIFKLTPEEMQQYGLTPTNNGPARSDPIASDNYGEASAKAYLRGVDGNPDGVPVSGIAQSDLHSSIQADILAGIQKQQQQAPSFPPPVPGHHDKKKETKRKEKKLKKKKEKQEKVKTRGWFGRHGKNKEDPNYHHETITIHPDGSRTIKKETVNVRTGNLVKTSVTEVRAPSQPEQSKIKIPCRPDSPKPLAVSSNSSTQDRASSKPPSNVPSQTPNQSKEKRPETKGNGGDRNQSSDGEPTAGDQLENQMEVQQSLLDSYLGFREIDIAQSSAEGTAHNKAEYQEFLEQQRAALEALEVQRHQQHQKPQPQEETPRRSFPQPHQQPQSVRRMPLPVETDQKHSSAMNVSNHSYDGSRSTVEDDDDDCSFDYAYDPPPVRNVIRQHSIVSEITTPWELTHEGDFSSVSDSPSEAELDYDSMDYVDDDQWDDLMMDMEQGGPEAARKWEAFLKNQEMAAKERE